MSFYPFQISKYISREFLKNFILFLLSGCILVFILDIIEVTRISSSKNFGTALICKFALLRNYQTLQKILPFIFLISSLKTYIDMNNRNEIVAFYSIGVNDMQLLSPSLLITLCFIFIHIIIFMPINSYMMLKYQSIEANKMHDIGSFLTISRDGIWLKQEGCIYNELEGNFNNTKQCDEKHNMIFNILRVNQATKEMHDVKIIFLNQDWHFSNIFKIKKLQEEENGIWKAEDVLIVDAENNYYQKAIVYFHLNASYQELLSGLMPPETINIWKMNDFINLVNSFGFSTIKYQVYFWKIFAQCLMFGIMVILGYIFNDKIIRVQSSHQVYIKGIFFGIFLYFVVEIVNVFLFPKDFEVYLKVLAPYCLLLFTVFYYFIHNRKLDKHYYKIG